MFWEYILRKSARARARDGTHFSQAMDKISSLKFDIELCWRMDSVMRDALQPQYFVFSMFANQLFGGFRNRTISTRLIDKLGILNERWLEYYRTMSIGMEPGIWTIPIVLCE